MKENLATKTKQVTTSPIYLGLSKNVSLIDFYRAIPKFYNGDRSHLRTQGESLKWLDIKFSFDAQDFRAIITPAQIIENKESIFSFPGIAEEQIEQAIWTLAHEYRQSYPNLLSDTFNFSANSIREKLFSRGLRYSIAEISRAVGILSATKIKVQRNTGEFKGSFANISPIIFLEVHHKEIITYSIELNRYFIKALNDGKFQPNAQGSASG